METIGGVAMTLLLLQTRSPSHGCVHSYNYGNNRGSAGINIKFQVCKDNLSGQEPKCQTKCVMSGSFSHSLSWGYGYLKSRCIARN